MHGHELVEGLAALVLVASGTFFLAAAWLARERVLRSRIADRPPVAPVDGRSASSAANATLASLAFGAAVIHLAVIPAHLAEFPPYGIAFAGLAIVQVAIGIAGLAGAWRLVRWPAITVTIGVIAVWIASRTMGLPVGPEAWHPEPIGVADVVATAFEIGLVAMLVLGRHVGLSSDPADRHANIVASIAIVPVVGLLGVTALLAAASFATDISGDHCHPETGESRDSCLDMRP